MKKYLLYIVIFLIGALAGMWAHRQYHFGEVTKMVQTDTVVVHDTMRYSRLELTANSCRLDLPKIVKTEFVYIPADSTTVIYRDSVRYVTLPRQYFFTKTDDAEIWHSGIDSTIDSLLVFRNDMVISKTETTTQTVTKRNALDLGIEAQYFGSFYAPVYLEYSYKPKPWIAVYGKVAYDIPTRLWGVGIGANISIQW